MQALTATAIALSIAAVGVRGYVQSQVFTARQAAGTAQGIQLDRLAAATDNYAIQNFSPLTGGPGQVLKADGVTPGTVANVLAPTVQELVTLGYLQAAFNPVSFFGGGYTVSLAKVPTGCSYPNCSIGGSVSLSNAIQRAGTPDLPTLGAAVQKIGADGGYSIPTTPNTISGASGGWSLSNPAGSVAGILAERVGQGAQRYNTFIRRDGALPMTAPLTLARADIGSSCVANTLAADSATGKPMQCVGGAWQLPSGALPPVVNYASLPNTGNSAGDMRVTLDTMRVFLWTGGGWSPVSVDQSGNLTVPGSITAAGGRVVAWNQVSEGGVLQLQGANGTNIYLESINGTFRLVNHPWNAQLFSVDQSGNVAASGTYYTSNANGYYANAVNYYGDSWNAAVRMPGWFYVQTQGGAGASNVVANDYWVAAAGKWASQLGVASACGIVGTMSWSCHYGFVPSTGYLGSYATVLTCGGDGNWKAAYIPTACSGIGGPG